MTGRIALGGVAAIMLSCGAAAAPPAAPDKPVYALRTRFSGTAEMVEWTSRPPPAARVAGKPAARAVATVQNGAGPAAVAVGLTDPRRRADRPQPLSSPFGWRADPILGTQRMHAGVDMAAPAGTAVVAASPGTVAVAGWVSGYGNCVVVDHGGGMQTRYAHLMQIAVGAGQPVQPGTVLGMVGSTGRSTGPHLHYEVRVNGRPINPLGR